MNVAVPATTVSAAVQEDRFSRRPDQTETRTTLTMSSVATRS